jgi:5-methylcytosine-specific restriction endonuclease McrA
MANKWGIPKDVEQQVLLRDTSCVYCGVIFTNERRFKASWEHIINDIRVATVENIALCCVGCNASKGAKLLLDWFDSPNSKRRGVTLDTISPVVRRALEAAVGTQGTVERSRKP